MATYREIATASVTSSGTQTIDITGIPDTFTDLVLHGSLRDNGTSNWFLITFNNDASSLYYQRTMWAGASTHATLYHSNTSRTNIIVDAITDSLHTANVFNNCMLYIPRYAGNKNKTCFIESVSEHDATNLAIRLMTAAKWTVTSPITSIQIKQTVSGFAANSTVSLYGISTSTS